jgi:hypothetical protein
MSDKPIFEVKLTNVRLSFPHLFKAQEGKVDPKTGKKGADKFNASFLIPKNTEEGKANHAKMKTAINAAAKAKWGDNIPKEIKAKPEKLCCRDGDLESYDGYEGSWYVSSSNAKRPTVIDRNKAPLVEADGKPFAGCYVNAIIRVWCQDNEHGKRVNASLEGVQYKAEGPAFGAAPLSDDAFDNEEGEFTDSGSSESSDDSLI